MSSVPDLSRRQVATAGGRCAALSGGGELSRVGRPGALSCGPPGVPPTQRLLSSAGVAVVRVRLLLLRQARCTLNRPGVSESLQALSTPRTAAAGQGGRGGAHAIKSADPVSTASPPRAAMPPPPPGSAGSACRDGRRGIVGGPGALEPDLCAWLSMQREQAPRVRV